MEQFWNLYLVHFLDFYFIFIFVAGISRRFAHYRQIGKMLVAVPGRWPRLLKLVTQERAILTTWTVLLPGALALTLSLVQLLASRLVWPEAGYPPDGLTIGRLVQHWPALLVVVPLGMLMFSVDFYSIAIDVKLDRSEVEKSFDKAEYWLRSPTAHIVKFFTLGYVNPRNMVASEVRKALEELNRLLHNTLWWLNLQVGIRLSFGLSIWLSWAFTRS